MPIKKYLFLLGFKITYKLPLTAEMNAKKILILGSGGREHAFAWKLSSEIGKENVFTLPGNAGTAECSTNVSIALNDFEAIGIYCINQQIDIILPGSEEPICNGIRDFFENDQKLSHIGIFSPNLEASRLESSKEYAKIFMEKHQIPTAKYQSFDQSTLSEGLQYLESLEEPYVLKADGLAAGKGVLILEDLQTAKNELTAMLDGKFGKASAKVVIEEFLSGIEFSVFALTDGQNYILLPEAKDYKRIGEGDTGLNTGGMGAVSPVPFFRHDLKKKTIEEIIEPTIKGLHKDGLNYRGFVFFGLINVNGQPKVIEYNVRMGDPETEVVIPRLAESFYELIVKGIEGSLENREAKQSSEYCVTVFNVAEGYPETYKKGIEMSVAKNLSCFHAGTTRNGGILTTNGGRVIACYTLADTLTDAIKKVYNKNLDIHFDGQFFRRDIGKDLIQLQENQ
jgi:phosphoribosylamine---glycine ligase